MRMFLKPKNSAHWHKWFKYEPSTGYLVNRCSRAARAQEGAIAGRLSNIGYVDVGIFGKKCGAHRIIWEMVNGKIPDGMEVDHINGVRDDNRISNLRLVTRNDNMRNIKLRCDNTSGFHGVGFNKNSGKFQARIWHRNIRRHLGLFNTAEEAHQAYLAAAKTFGYHENHGRCV